jgi:hypothetical protein
MLQKGLEGRSDSPLVLDAELIELSKDLIVGPGGFARGFEVQ